MTRLHWARVCKSISEDDGCALESVICGPVAGVAVEGEWQGVGSVSQTRAAYECCMTSLMCNSLMMSCHVLLMCVSYVIPVYPNHTRSS